MDGNNLCVPATYSDVFSSAVGPTPITANSITRICKNVAAGAHTMQVQMRSDSADGGAMGSHVLTVTHN
jgi:hypothetical protein